MLGATGWNVFDLLAVRAAGEGMVSYIDDPALKFDPPYLFKKLSSYVRASADFCDRFAT